MELPVEDAGGTGKAAAVRAAWAAVAARMAAEGHSLRHPVRAHLARIPVLGASRFEGGVHQLFVSERATANPASLQGLLAHELGHMVLTERAHPSHDPGLLEGIARRVAADRDVRGPRLLVEGLKHGQDIYADDLAFPAIGPGFAVPFFTGWIEGNLQHLRSFPAAAEATARWATNAFALATLERHGLAPAGKAAYTAAAAYDLEGGFTATDRLVTAYRNLPPAGDAATVAAAMSQVALVLALEATRRGL